MLTIQEAIQLYKQAELARADMMNHSHAATQVELDELWAEYIGCDSVDDAYVARYEEIKARRALCDSKERAYREIGLRLRNEMNTWAKDEWRLLFDYIDAVKSPDTVLTVDVLYKLTGYAMYNTSVLEDYVTKFKNSKGV